MYSKCRGLRKPYDDCWKKNHLNWIENETGKIQFTNCVGRGKWGGRSRILDDDDGDDDPETWQTCQEPQGIRNWGKKPRSGITFDALLFSVASSNGICIIEQYLLAEKRLTLSSTTFFVFLSFLSGVCQEEWRLSSLWPFFYFPDTPPRCSVLNSKRSDPKIVYRSARLSFSFKSIRFRVILSTITYLYD